ncbi:hypothetical protein AGABI2DRAFT_116642 [Agaricus bisporus var. bisporus H97]|uniref:hypothetical protein n=1 Tax=Agaricus bisporus var. bisporus (strain H97 / ATCC MYA-4626 / FGSC 10389) TaxID=936046 RepID=UPI00029F62A5|nr:hypothetical protein AGABI2DRAFT_116642 [Agaricus bisporus var. bisporus H97]EKV49610.1 hypothetical protein AGABI2DRAFT_116642 [Agaricus bisporus var. bisporus H97]
MLYVIHDTSFDIVAELMAITTIYDKNLNAADKNRFISKIVVTASSTVSTTIDGNYYHWRIYLQLSQSDISNSSSKSVILDMIPTNPPTSTLMITSNAYASSNSPAKIEFDIFPAKPLTVGQVIDLFIEKGMHRYTFDATGSGCLFWIMTGIHHLHEANLIEAGAPNKFHTFHMAQANLHPERHPLPLRKGTFY